MLALRMHEAAGLLRYELNCREMGFQFGAGAKCRCRRTGRDCARGRANQTRSCYSGVMSGFERQACSQRSDLMLPMLPLLDSVEGSTLGALKNLSYHASFQVVQVGGGGGAGRPQKSIAFLFGTRLKLSIATLLCVCVC